MAGGHQLIEVALSSAHSGWRLDRALADAVLIGTGTLRAEGYARLVGSEDRRARREAAGLAPDPVAVLLSRGLDLPWDAGLFAAIDRLSGVAAEAGVSLVELALRWVAHRPEVGSVLLGGSRPEQLTANVAAIAAGPLPADVVAACVTGPGEATPPYSQPGGSMVAPPNTALITVGNTDVRYAHLVEYGHSGGFNGSTVPPHPFFWPGLRLGRKRAEAAIKRAIRKAIKEAK